jgi:CopG family nickel-responsive transcriptional regulator
MSKRDALVRFGVAMESSLLEPFDALVKQRGSTRSEVLRDLARAEVTREAVATGGDAVATVTIVYDHHVRALTETLTSLQHELGDAVRSTMHVHLDPSYCLEVIILQGKSTELRRFADRVFATRGVKHGGIEMIAAGGLGGGGTRGGLHVHLHEHEHPHGHGHEHAHGHAGHGHAGHGRDHGHGGDGGDVGHAHGHGGRGAHAAATAKASARPKAKARAKAKAKAPAKAK